MFSELRNALTYVHRYLVKRLKATSLGKYVAEDWLLGDRDDVRDGANLAESLQEKCSADG